MTIAIAANRQVRRVPLDFDAPLGEVWEGYRMPDELRPPRCQACEGTGWSPTYRWLQATFYANPLTGTPGWYDCLTQGDVDELVAQDRLRHWQPDGSQRGGRWVAVPRDAADVNANQRRALRDRDRELDHDGTNLYLLARRRCALLGASDVCERCDGRTFDCTPQQYAAYQAWTLTQPPAGDGWQLWETTTDGAPITPVFATADELAACCAGMFGAGRDQWARWITGDEVSSLALVSV